MREEDFDNDLMSEDEDKKDWLLSEESDVSI